MSASKESGRMQFHVFCSSDLDNDPVTLICELENAPAYTRNELSRSQVFQKSMMMTTTTTTMMMMMMMMMESPVGTTYQLRSHTTSCESSYDRQGRFLRWIVDRSHHRVLYLWTLLQGRTDLWNLSVGFQELQHYEQTDRHTQRQMRPNALGLRHKNDRWQK